MPVVYLAANHAVFCTSGSCAWRRPYSTSSKRGVSCNHANLILYQLFFFGLKEDYLCNVWPASCGKSFFVDQMVSRSAYRTMLNTD